MIPLDEQQSFLRHLHSQIITSSELMSEYSKLHCKGAYVNRRDCSWYHGAWQYLRCCDRVSSPTWHAEFYIDSLSASTTNGSTLLISGAADYSMLALIHLVISKLNLSVNIDVVDICQTPLLICDWYAEQTNLSIGLINEDIFSFQPQRTYDLIVTDAFLTRFPAIKKQDLLSVWFGLLRDCGKVITTIRVEDLPEGENVVIVPDTQRNNFVKQTVEVYSQMNLKGIDSIELRAKKYIQNITSYPYKAISDVENDFESAGLQIIHASNAVVSGEACPSRYYRIVAQKGTP